MKIQNIKVVDICPYAKNAKGHPEKQVKQIIASIQEFGFNQPLVVDSNNTIIVGHGRFEAAKALGLLEVPCYVVDLTEEQAKAYRLADNKLNESDWDMGLVVTELKELEIVGFNIDLTGFDVDLLENEPTVEEDDFVVDENAKTNIVLGDLIEIGEHRLLCGDSTDSDAVARLMNGDKWNLLATSPPYNQGGSNGDLLHTKGLGVGKKQASLYNQKNSDNKTADEYFQFSIDILTTASIYKNEEAHTVCWNIAYNSKSRDDYGRIVFAEQNPFRVKETIIWDKTHSINLPQVGIYSRRCEFVFVMSANDKYHTSQTYNDCRWNYWQIKSAGSQVTGESTEHRAAYPIEFASKMITDFSLQKDLIYEPFTGSGTTMVSAQQLNRKCYGMEIDPKYCQMIVDRMLNLDPSLEVEINGVPYNPENNG